MNNTQQFVEDAIKGGYEKLEKSSEDLYYWKNQHWGYYGDNWVRDAEILLDPLAWQAVGKTRGWVEEYCAGCGNVGIANCDGSTDNCCMDTDESMEKQITFIRKLQDGLSIEEALDKIGL